MRLVVAEKPSVAAALAAALGVKNKKDGYMAVSYTHLDVYKRQVCTRSQRPVPHKDKGCFQSHEATAYLLCGGAPCRIAAFLFAQRQHRHKPCGVRDDPQYVLYYHILERRIKALRLEFIDKITLYSHVDSMSKVKHRSEERRVGKECRL